MSNAKSSPHVSSQNSVIGTGGELHQHAAVALTTNQGVAVVDDQNQLKAGPRGPALLEDFHLREKIFHFDHERIPERIVHARGSAAHGYFELYESLADITSADIFQRAGEKTPVFTRFSTVAGGAGSVDTPRDVRGFAVKFYTKQGNWDLVGNNVPVFFIQDAMKFPDLVHAVKMEADRGYPQAATAHDTFWDFISLMPETTNMVMWIMSDRTLPRKFATMEGFGVHTFRLVNKDGKSTFVKFHWKPKAGLRSTVWDETVKIAGADPDFQRRDLYESIERGDYPEWELGLQLFDEAQAAALPFDVLDATKIIPEELVPVRLVGRMVLDRNPDNFFAETEQVAYCPANIVPGIEFSNDPLLQGRLFSYLDTQLKRLGSPNFHQIPVNQPKQCPVMNFQRDGHMQTALFKGRANYEPNSLAEASEDGGPRECPQRGFKSFAEPMTGTKTRHRSESFGDHYSQARQFYRSLHAAEQGHLVSALVFELAKVSLPHIRRRVLSNLCNVDATLVRRVANGLNEAVPPASTPFVAPQDLPQSEALRVIGRGGPSTLEGQSVAIMIADGSDANTLKEVTDAVERAKGTVVLVAPKIGVIKLSDGSTVKADALIAGHPSVLSDAAAVVVQADAAEQLTKESAAVQFVTDAFVHLKALGFSTGAQPLLDRAGVEPDAGVIALPSTEFAKRAAERYFDREPKVRTVP